MTSTFDTTKLLTELRSIAGPKHVLTGLRQTKRYRKGFRSGEGLALAVVRPATLLQFWNVLKACVAANSIVIIQAANTGLTEGSTPNGDDYDRPVVLVNTLRMDRIDLLHGGTEILSLPGGTLYRLEERLKPIGRQPHSVIGSSCIGASIVGGICNNSGGSLVKRGPAYTELALYAQVDDCGQLQLVNNLAIELGNSPEEILNRLDKGDYCQADISFPKGTIDKDDYSIKVRDVCASTPARFNADPTRLHGASGCAGKLAVFAVRLDTFPSDGSTQVFFIGTDEPNDLATMRRHMLRHFSNLPIAAEYMHRDTFDVARRYGKDTFVMIETFGTAMMPKFFNLKSHIDTFLSRLLLFPSDAMEHFLQRAIRFWPERLPARLVTFSGEFEHHLLLKMSGDGIEEARRYLAIHFAPTGTAKQARYFECNEEEGRKAFLLRFAAAGAAIRYSIVDGPGPANLLALDVALPRNTSEWSETLPDGLADKCALRLYYGHFFCHVFHQDYVVRQGVNLGWFKRQVLETLDKRGAEYPAEHNVGHLYSAKPALKSFYATLDPTNTFNPGIGKTSKRMALVCECNPIPSIFCSVISEDEKATVAPIVRPAEKIQE